MRGERPAWPRPTCTPGNMKCPSSYESMVTFVQCTDQSDFEIVPEKSINTGVFQQPTVSSSPIFVFTYLLTIREANLRKGTACANQSKAIELQVSYTATFVPRYRSPTPAQPRHVRRRRLPSRFLQGLRLSVLT